jgi:transcriptional regulator with XRE-family HTH domain
MWDCGSVKEMKTNVLLGKRLRALREKRGWSQEYCAEQCGLHRTYIGAVERGERNVTLDTVDKIASAFGMTGRELLTVKESPL